MTEPLRVWSYSRCSTCRKALQWLLDHGIDVDVVDITQHPPDRALLASAAAFFGDRKPLFNTSGQSYRALGAATVKAMSDDEALDALAADGKLIKRPFAITDAGTALVGFKPEEWQAALES